MHSSNYFYYGVRYFCSGYDRIFDHCLESAKHDKEVVNEGLEKALPLTFPEAVEAIEDGLYFPFGQQLALGDNALDVSMEDVGEEGEDSPGSNGDE